MMIAGLPVRRLLHTKICLVARNTFQIESTVSFMMLTCV